MDDGQPMDDFEEAASTSADDRLWRMFQSLDTDADGHLSISEVKAALRQLGLPTGSLYVGDLLAQYDRDRSQSIDFPEFRSYVESKERRMRQVFQRIDVDGDGQLTAAELHRAATTLGLSVEASEASRMVALLDSDGDGRIEYDEYRRFVALLPAAQLSHTRILSAWLDSASWCASMEYRLGHVPPSQPLERLLAGGVAGAVSRTVVAPLERLRTIMMANPSARLRPTLRSMWADGGLRGLFRGNAATVAKVFPSSAIQFAVYDACKEVMLAYRGPGVTDLSTRDKLLAGLASGATACTATYPLEALRTQVCVAHGAAGASQGYLAIMRSAVAERGLRGLYQGYTAGLANSSVALAMSFATYEFFLTSYRSYSGDAPSPGAKGILGGGAALVTMSACMPLENVMRRMQVQGRPGFPARYAGVGDCVAQMLRHEGVSAFWRGSLSSFAKVAPSIAATRLLYESIVELRGIGGVRRYRGGGGDD